MSKSKKVLVIGFVHPEPKSSAAGNRMMQLLQLFIDFGYKIIFATTAQNSDFSENLTNLQIDSVQIELNSETFNDFIKLVNPEIVLFDRFMTEEQFGWRVSESCPDAIKILDTEDFHSLRFERQKAVKQNRDFDFKDLLLSDTAKREIASIYRCDLSLFVSNFEIDLIKNLFGVPSQLLWYLPIFAEKKVLKNSDFENRIDFVFIGNFLHEPNIDCVQFLYNSIWNKIRIHLPEAKMQIYGAYTSQKVMQLHQPKNNFFINNRANNSFEVIEKARVFLAPIRFGAGIKGKLLEAMQCGTPSVTTSIGAEDMSANLLWSGFIEDDVITFVQKAVQLYENKNIWEVCQQNGFELLEQKYDRILYLNDFELCLNNLIQNLDLFRSQNYTGRLLQSQLLSSTKYMSKWIEEKNKKSNL